MAAFTVPAAAKQLDIPESTIWKWTKRMGLGFKTASGAFRLTEDDLAKLKVTRALREEGHDFATIRQRLKAVGGPDNTPAGRRLRIEPEHTTVLQTRANPGEAYAAGRERVSDLLAQVQSLQERLADALRRHQNDCQLLTDALPAPGGSA